MKLSECFLRFWEHSIFQQVCPTSYTKNVALGFNNCTLSSVTGNVKYMSSPFFFTFTKGGTPNPQRPLLSLFWFGRQWGSACLQNIKQIPIALQIKTGLTIGIGIGCPTVCLDHRLACFVTELNEKCVLFKVKRYSYAFFLETSCPPRTVHLKKLKQYWGWISICRKSLSFDSWPLWINKSAHEYVSHSNQACLTQESPFITFSFTVLTLHFLFTLNYMLPNRLSICNEYYSS